MKLNQLSVTRAHRDPRRETLIDGVNFATEAGGEQIRILGQRLWYAPWSRAPDVVFRNCNITVKETSQASSITNDWVP